MKSKTVIPLVIGLAVGLIAIKLGVDMVNKAKGNQEAKRSVLVSSRMIDSAALISDVMFSAREVPASLVPPDAFTDPKQLENRVTRMPIPAGLPITQSMLAPPGSEPGLGAKIPAGHRAVSVSVNEETAVGGFLTPGCRVDVYALTNTRSQSADSRLILSNIEVGAVGQSLSQTGPDGKTVNIAKSVTLFLKPDQVQVINAATGGRGKGKVRLAMRGFGDEPQDNLFAQMFKNAFANMSDMKLKVEEPVPAFEEPAPEPRRAAKYHIVEVRRGEQLERVVFDDRGTPLRSADGSPLPAQAVPSGMPEEADITEELDQPVEMTE